MSHPLGVFVTGTDTNVGKTVVSAALVRLLEARYWKPVQSGLEDDPGGDTAEVARLTGRRPGDFPAPFVSLRRSLSPDQAAEEQGLSIAAEHICLPDVPGPLVIEGAGGLLVPVSRDMRMCDLAARFGFPVVVVARTGLGTINHTVLSLEALAHRNIPVAGVIFSGEDHPRNIRSIEFWGRVPVLGRIPVLDPLSAATLEQAVRALDQEKVRRCIAAPFGAGRAP